MAADDSILPRGLQRSLDESLQDTPVICLLGPRQCGKSTLTKSLAPNRDYLDLDDDNLADTALADPAGFVRGLPEKVTLDEVQRVPEILRALKVSVDANRTPGRYILTGSANLLLLPRASESLAGRMEILRLHPLTESEKEKTPGLFLETLLTTGFSPEIRPSTDEHATLPERLVTGGYPEARKRSPHRIPVWHRNYLQTLFEKDAPEISTIRDSSQLLRLITKLALQSGSLLNKSSLSRDLDLDRETVDHYLAVLERLFLIRTLPAWHRNRSKRLVKSPKIHLTDSGLAATLMDLRPSDWNPRRQDFGHLLESFVVQQLMAQAGWTDPTLQFNHYRDRDQVEVDCLISRGNQVWGIEVKTSRSVSPADYKGLKKLAEQVGQDFQSGIILYSGDSILSSGDDRFLAVPLSKLWEL
ncbi:MAG: ATP-binding protein [Verrucomicrobiota bacterium]